LLYNSQIQTCFIIHRFRLVLLFTDSDLFYYSQFQTCECFLHEGSRVVPLLQKSYVFLSVIALVRRLFNFHWFFIHRYRLTSGTNEKIQLSSLIAAFQVTRDMIVDEAK